MGWTSTGDPYANVGDAGLSFESEEAAKEFAEKHGWEYTVCASSSTNLYLTTELYPSLVSLEFPFRFCYNLYKDSILTAVQVRKRHTPLLRVRHFPIPN